MYARESLSYVIQAYTSSLYTDLGIKTENHDTTYTLQPYDGGSILQVLSYPHRCAYYLHLSWHSCSSVVLTIICQPLRIYVALDLALDQKFTLNCETQQLSHDWHFQGNTREKNNTRESKVSLNFSLDSS